jgi:hypothetical protein
LQPANLPSNPHARLINTLGSAFEPVFGGGAASTIGKLRNWFTAAGYTEPIGDASVEGLKQAQGDGVFYLSSHGSWGNTRGEYTSYGVWTSDEVSADNDVRFSADLNSNPPRLCWYRALDNNNLIGENRRTHYAITPDFVRTYMKFGTNSLVFFNACGSDQVDFKAACIEKNAGVYLGWTNNIDAQQGLKAARFLFDRLLGAHQETPAENPPQRPFEVTYVLEDMLLRNFDTHIGNKGPTTLLATPPYGYGGEPTLIAPTIQWGIPPLVDGDVNILIDGSYGDNPGSAGSVKLGNNALSIANWTPGRIECPVPASGGNLVVKIQGIKSNTIQLTEWHAQFTVFYHGKQSLQQKVVLNINFWADVHNWRSLPHKPANFWQPRYFYVMPNSSCQFESSGKEVSDLDTNSVIESWSNAVTPALSRSFLEDTFFGMQGLVDSVGRSSLFQLRFQGKYTRFLAGSGTSEEIFSPPFQLSQIIGQMADGYVLPGGSIPWSEGDFSGTFTWNTLQPLYPPDPTGGW